MLENEVNKAKYRWYICISVVIAVIGLLIWIANGYILEVRCKANLKAISGALNIYYNDYETFPNSEVWCDALIKEGIISKEYFRCPKRSVANSQGHYILNAAVEKSIVRESDKKGYVLVFEGESGWNQVGGLEKAAFIHKGKCGVVFSTGRIELLKPDELERLLKNN